MEFWNKNGRLVKISASILCLIILVLIFAITQKDSKSENDVKNNTLNSDTLEKNKTPTSVSTEKVDSEEKVQVPVATPETEVREEKIGLSYVLPKSFGTSIATTSDLNDEFRPYDAELTFSSTDFKIYKNPTGLGCGGFESSMVDEKIIKTVDGEEFQIRLVKYIPATYDENGMELEKSTADAVYGMNAVNFHGTNTDGTELTINPGYSILSIGHICGAGANSEKSLENAKVRFEVLIKFIESIKLAK